MRYGPQVEWYTASLCYHTTFSIAKGCREVHTVPRTTCEWAVRTTVMASSSAKPARLFLTISNSMAWSLGTSIAVTILNPHANRDKTTFPKSSARAPQPGGTTVVASMSSQDDRSLDPEPTQVLP